MADWILDKKDLGSLLETWNRSRDVLVPSGTGTISRFQQYESGKNSMDFNIRIPPKELFLPNGEVLFEYAPDGGIKPSQMESPERLLFGIRPCDARAVSTLELVFGDPEFYDELYVNKRRSSIFVGLGCNLPKSTCFCTSVGGDPFDSRALDIIMVDLGDRYYIKAVTIRGQKLMDEVRELTRECGDPERLEVEKVTRDARSGMASLPVDQMQQRLEHMFNDPYWENLHEICIGCGVCTYLCPTCHCFDVSDEGYPAGKRVRTWDSCQFPLFTLHTSGHNPRPTGLERWRQRLMHKFNYFQRNYQATGCVGCGRCITNCPVNLDIRQVIQEIGGVDLEHGVCT